MHDVLIIFSNLVSEKKHACWVFAKLLFDALSAVNEVASVSIIYPLTEGSRLLQISATRGKKCTWR